MRHKLFLEIPQNTNPSYEVSKKNEYIILEDKCNNSRTYVGQPWVLNKLEPAELKSLDRIFLGNDSPRCTDDWYTLEESIYFEYSEKYDSLPELTTLTNLLKQYPNIHELRIPICYAYGYNRFHTHGTADGDYVDHLFKELDSITSLTTLHLNWADFREANRKNLIEKLSKNPHLREVHFHHSIYLEEMDNFNHIKKLSRSDIPHLNELRKIPENERPSQWSDAKITSFIQTLQMEDVDIGHLKKFYVSKQPMTPELAYSIKKLFEVPLYDDLVQPLADCSSARKTDLKIFLHGLRIDERQAKYLSSTLGQSNHVSIYAQNTQITPAQQNSAYLISRSKPDNADQPSVLKAENRKFHFFN